MDFLIANQHYLHSRIVLWYRFALRNMYWGVIFKRIIVNKMLKYTFIHLRVFIRHYYEFKIFQKSNVNTKIWKLSWINRHNQKWRIIRINSATPPRLKDSGNSKKTECFFTFYTLNRTETLNKMCKLICKIMRREMQKEN